MLLVTLLVGDAMPTSFLVATHLLAPRLAEDAARIFCALCSYVYKLSSLLLLLVMHLQCLSGLENS